MNGTSSRGRTLRLEVLESRVLLASDLLPDRFEPNDTTDEPAMAEAQSRGGFAIKIGDGMTAARHRLPDPSALAGWLDEALQKN